MLAIIAREMMKWGAWQREDAGGRGWGTRGSRIGVRSIERPVRYTGLMTKGEVKDLLDRVLTWSADDREKFLRFVCEVEQWRANDDSIDEQGGQHEIIDGQKVTEFHR